MKQSKREGKIADFNHTKLTIKDRESGKIISSTLSSYSKIIENNNSNISNYKDSSTNHQKNKNIDVDSSQPIHPLENAPTTANYAEDSAIKNIRKKIVQDSPETLSHISDSKRKNKQDLLCVSRVSYLFLHSQVYYLPVIKAIVKFLKCLVILM